MKAFPTLYKAVGKGKIKKWDIQAAANQNGEALINKYHGFTDGKIQLIERRIKGKNIGRSNETKPYHQAILEAESAWKKKQDKGYTMTEDGVCLMTLPMLAQKFKKAKHRIVYPAIAQPKLNGIRFLATKRGASELDIRSRKNKSFNELMVHLRQPLLDFMVDDEIMDGELYHHGWNFQRILKASKKIREDTLGLQAHLFDIADDKLDNNQRANRLAWMFNNTTANNLVWYVETRVIRSEDEVYKFHAEYIKQGYEGIMIRNMDAKYQFNKRPADLQKYKLFFDKEVIITGGFPATGGNEDGCVIFEVHDPEFGTDFTSRPRGTFEDRRRWMADIENLKGKELTIRFQEYSDLNKPVFNVGIAIRDYE